MARRQDTRRYRRGDKKLLGNRNAGKDPEMDWGKRKRNRALDGTARDENEAARLRDEYLRKKSLGDSPLPWAHCNASTIYGPTGEIVW